MIKNKNPKSIFIFISVIWTIYYLTHSISKYENYLSWTFDLGIYTNAIYQYSQGNLAYSPFIDLLMLANNFEPILILLSPLYKIIPTPITLLIIQAIFVGLSIYLLSQTIHTILQNKLYSSILANLYASSIGILFAINYDFHPTTLSVLPLCMLLYSYFHNKKVTYFLTLFISILFRQDIPIYIVGLGLYQLVRKQYRIGFATIFLGLLTFSIIQFFFFPNITSDPTNPYSAITRFKSSNLTQSDPLSIINMLFLPEIKTQNTLLLYGQYLFLPIFSILNLLTVIPYLFLRYTSSYDMVWTYSIYHNSTLEPFLAISTSLALNSIQTVAKKTVHLFKPAVLTTITYLFATSILILKITVLTLFFTSTIKFISSIPKYSYIHQALQKIPPEASISTQSELIARLANRNKIYMFPIIKDAQYLIIDTQLSSANWHIDELQTGMFTKETFTSLINTKIANSEWNKIYQSNSLSIYTRNSYEP